ncbi:FprA family A-type flavoprotein [Clostridium sartagoforme]|uniref:FprA family A-type flavoprotein n=1 Tax=Clostridium sartagoforme TaxID=84031 RepID=A0A4S2DQM9_9CLOT|nr:MULTISPECIES: FprA family A-type flavoprotein [Clostridium]MBS5936970.1 FprA family A-type flavoprotein [Clostridium sp.]TGY43454.1 FprA family A-type flavoprotein [Clostridium sartagoforme]
MFCVRKVVEDIYWVGGNDRRLALFENLHPLPKGVSYNSYLLLDEKTVLFDTVDWSISRQFFENVEAVLKGRKLDYLVVNHMEPDHAACIEEIILRYPEVKIISTDKSFVFMRQFGFDTDDRIEMVADGDTKSFGKHEFKFITAPMVHWPEVMVSFDMTTGILFSADAFGTFGTLDGKLFNDEVNFERDWIDEARRYYTNIVGKYGPHVQILFKKIKDLDIKMICPLHGPVWRNNLSYFIEKYDKWSKYEPEEEGVMIVYSSMYGNTESAANVLATKFVEKGITNLVIYDVSNTHVSTLISETFRVSHLVIASVTYNSGIYPPMHNYLIDMKALNLQKRTVALIENGSWACNTGKLIGDFFAGMKNMTLLDNKVTLLSAMNEKNGVDMDALVDGVIKSMK